MDERTYIEREAREAEEAWARRSFVHLARAWYAPHIRDDRGFEDDIIIATEGDGEITIRWYIVGGTLVPRLEVFADGWLELSRETALLGMLATYHKSNLSPMEMCAALEAIGFTDATPTTKEHAQ